MDIKSFFSRLYWHIFKAMPRERYHKILWDEYRRMESQYLNCRYDLQSLVPQSVNKCIGGGKNLFVYWNSGFDAAPPIVKKCIETIQRHTPVGWQLHLISEENVHEYVCMPSFMTDGLKEGRLLPAHYADALRTALLWLYGGLWLDATCFLTKDIPQTILDADLFMFRTEAVWRATPFVFENWFIRSSKDNYVMERQLQNFLAYCQTYRRPKSIYYVWYDILAALYNNDPKARQLMDAIFYWPAAETWLMTPVYTLDAPCDDRLWDYLKNKCFLQKLTYKYSEECAHHKGNILSYVLGKQK